MFSNISVELSIGELTDLVKQKVRLEMQREVLSVTFNVVTRSMGYGLNERDEKVFTGVSVKLGKPVKRLPSGPFDR